MTGNTRRVDIDRGSPVPLYRQIAEYIRTRIEDGRYPSGTLVPSYQRIHQETGVAVKTVQLGIRLLAEQGWVLIVKGKGTYVNTPDRWPSEGEWPQQVDDGKPSVIHPGTPVIEIEQRP